jgi:hypothetical protein
VIAVVMLGGFVSVGIACYRSLKIDPFTSPCTADRTENDKYMIAGGHGVSTEFDSTCLAFVLLGYIGFYSDCTLV